MAVCYALAVAVKQLANLFYISIKHIMCMLVDVPNILCQENVVAAFLQTALSNIHKVQLIGRTQPLIALCNICRYGNSSSLKL